MAWTQFWDMHSGGGTKHTYEYIYIEAPEEEAKVIFYNRFGTNPERISCTCCGDDYSISTSKTLKLASAYQRNCTTVEKGTSRGSDYEWHYIDGDGKGKGEKVPKGFRAARDSYGEWMSLAKYKKSEDVHFIYAKDITPDERIGDVPEEGYVWV